MKFAISTHWNARRHTDGEAMLEEVRQLGFTQVELGYDTRLDLIEGIEKAVNEKVIEVGSLHNFCPVPMGAPKGHPELWTFASKDRRIRSAAITNTRNTLEFASKVGARAIVVHSGYVDTRTGSHQLLGLLRQGHGFDPVYEPLKAKLQREREKKAKKHLKVFKEAVETLIPLLDEYHVTVAFENLPSWEAVPNEMELFQLLQEWNHPKVKYWYDIGHGQIRENMGFINTLRWLERLMPYTAGFHIHDVIDKVEDHIMPPHGEVRFDAFNQFIREDVLRVIEPSPNTPAEAIKDALNFFNNTWNN